LSEGNKKLIFTNFLLTANSKTFLKKFNKIVKDNSDNCPYPLYFLELGLA
jgi:hypothetical protein